MSAETIWFRHDTGALSDRLMQRLMRRHGMEGVGVYWGIVEALYQEDGIIQLDHIEDLAFTFHVDEETVDTIVRESGLFKIDGESFYSERISRELDLKNEKSEKARKAVNSRRDRNNDNEESTVEQTNNECTTDVERTYNECTTSTVQYSTVQNNTEDKNKKKSGDSDESPPSTTMEQAGKLAHLIEDLHRKQDPKYKGKPESWTMDIEKLIRIDGRDPTEISKVIAWVKQPDSFWFPNIISGKKLREKYPTLKAQMQREKKLKKPKYKTTEGHEYEFTEDNFQEA